MKLIITFCVACVQFGALYAQTIYTYELNENNASALIRDGGSFFTDPVTNSGAYEIPSGSLLNAVYAMSFIYAAQDVNGQIKMSVQTYGELQDQFKGPLSTDGSAQAIPGANLDNYLFPITKAEIIDHLNNYTTPGYVPTSNINNWPAHGDVSLNQDFYLAPFIDYNMDGTYNPLDGDYPCIRGDRAVYLIMNDNAMPHASGGDRLGIEMHYMFYQYATNDALNDVTFVHGKVINRGTQVLTNMRIGNFMDVDLGNPFDDYFGSDSTRKLMYFYNGDNVDETNAGNLGYQTPPPAFGVVSLGDPFAYISEFPSQPNIWYVLNGFNNNGLPWTNEATGVPTHYQFSGDPNNPTDLNTQYNLISPADMKGIATLDAGTLGFGDVVEFDLAYVFAINGTDHLDNVAELQQTTDFAQDFFDNEQMDCFTSLAGIAQNESVEVAIFPNPSNGLFEIDLKQGFGNASVTVIDLTGREVYVRNELKSASTTIELNQPPGVYIMNLEVDGQSVIRKIIIE